MKRVGLSGLFIRGTNGWETNHQGRLTINGEREEKGGGSPHGDDGTGFIPQTPT